MGSASASAGLSVAERLGALGVKTPSVFQNGVSPVFYCSFTPAISGGGGPTLLWNCYPSITVGLAPAAWLWASPTGYTHNAPSVAWVPRPLVPATPVPGAPPSVACQLLILHLSPPHATWVLARQVPLGCGLCGPQPSCVGLLLVCTLARPRVLGCPGSLGSVPWCTFRGCLPDPAATASQAGP